MNRFVRSLVRGCLPLVLMIAGISTLQAQSSSVFDPSDPIVVYNPNNPPTEPPFGQPGKWVKRNRVNWNTSSFKAYIYKGVQFRLKWPKNYDASGNTKYPLFLFFHGIGERGSIYDNEYQLYHGGELHKNAVDNGQFNGFLLYPQSSSSDGNWNTQLRQYIKELIENFLVPEVNVDPFRVVVDGLSGGGLSTWRFFASYPTLTAACLPISSSGSGFNDIVINNKFTPIWLFQGGLDLNPPPSASQNLKRLSDNAGGNFTYTEYPDLGHGCWYSAWGEADYFPYLTRAYKSNPWPLNGRTEFCNTGTGSISTTIGVSAGFNEYQWRKNGVLISELPSTANTLTVTDVGIYSCRIRKGTTWSEWSPIPVEIKYKTNTIPPIIKVSGLASRVLPAPDGKTTVSLEVPPGYTAYDWQKVGDPSTLSTGNVLTGVTVGEYKVQVTEQFGCSSAFTDPFKVINADGPNKPDAATGLIAIPLSYTSMKLTWSSNPNPVYPQTHFEIYQATKSGGPYQFLSIVDGNVFSFVREGLKPGVKYYYIVRAVNNTAAAPVSNEASASTQKDTHPPTAPANLHVTGTTRNYVALAWEESTDDVGMDHYEIYVNGVKSYVTGETQYTVFGLEYGKLYNFTIKAVDIAGNKSAPSNQVTAQPLAKGLIFKHYTGTWDNLPDFNLLTPISTGVVPNVTLENASQAENYAFLWEGFIRVPEDGYYVFSSTSDDGSKIYLDLNSSHTSSPYSHTATAIVNNDGLHGSQTVSSSRISLSANAVYPIAITFFQKGGGANMGISWRRVNQSGSTTFWSGAVPDSAFVDPSPPPAGTVPAKPSNLAATAVSFKRINLTWSDNSNNEKSFELYRSTDPLNNFITIGVLPANTTSFADTLVEPATTYYYKVRAINQYGESLFDKVGPGVDYTYYERTGMSVVPDFNTMTPLKAGRVSTIGLGMQMRPDNFALKFEGSINIVTEGDYTFYLKSDDGSQLYIDGSLVVNNDGLHNSSNEIPGQVTLTAGSHSIRVTFFEATGDEVLIVKYQGPGVAKQDIPANILGDILANATTLAAPAAPLPPDSLTAVGINNSAIKIAWKNKAGNANGIELYRSYNGNSDYVLFAELPANASFYNDTELYPSSLFYYKVRAIGEGGPSDFSNEKDARTLGVVPSILPVENVYMRYNSVVNLPIEATSGSSSVNITLQVSNLPPFAVFNQTGNGKGVISFSPSSSDAGVYSNIIITASNPQGDINTAQFNLTVNDNYIPHINAIPNAAVAEKSTLQVNLSATDNDASDQLMWSYAGLPKFATTASSNRSAVLTFKPQYGDEGEYRIKAYVSDGRNGKDTASFILKVTHTNVSDPNDGTVPVGPQNIKGVFVDTLNGVKITWTNAAYNALRNEIYRSTYMTGGYILQSPGAINKDDSAYVDYSVEGNKTYYYLVRAVNANGGSNSLIVKVTTPNRAPVINTNDISIKGGNVKDVSITATDDAGDIITLTASNLPSFATFADNGNGNGVMHLSPTGTHIGTFEGITIKASDNQGAVSVKTIRIIVTDKYITSVYVNFNNKDYPIGFRPWNSFDVVQTEAAKVPANTAISNLKDEAGETTAVSVKLLESWSQIYNGKITGNNTGVFPDSIIMSGYFFAKNASNPQKTIRISGLSNSKKYNLIFFASSTSGSALLNTYYTAGGHTVSLNPKSNTTNTVQINELVANQGIVDVVVNAEGDGKYGVISAMVIQEYDDGIVLPPYKLDTRSTKNSINLTWECNATNITAFEIWRSDTPDGTYVKLPASVPGNVFTYTDGGLTKGTVYYYKVRAVSNGQFSDFSDYSSGATVKYTVNINFNDGIGLEPVPWNNTDLLFNGYKLANLLNDDNQNTGINLTVVDNFSGFNNWGKTTGNNSGVVSDNIMQEFYYVQYGETTRLMIDGLNLGARYNFVFFGNCDNRAFGTLVSLYTIGEETVQLDARNNTQNTIQISNVEPDAQGRIMITVRALAPGYGFVNSISIQEVPSATAEGGSSSRKSDSNASLLSSSLIDIPTDESLEAEIAATVYPVPIRNDVMLRLSLKNPAEKLIVTLIDNNGRPLFSQELRDLLKGKNERKLNFRGEGLTPGIYFIRITGWKDGYSKMIKIVK